MGRAYEVIRTRELDDLFGFFGLQAEKALVDAYRTAIASRFAFEVQEIVRLCSNLRERARYQLFREALRLAYETAVRRATAAA